MSDDRLTHLGMARRALRWARIDSPEAFGCASLEQFTDLVDHVPLLRRLIRQRRPDVLVALFDSPDWYVALLLTDTADRLLCIDGREPTLYRADDREGERRAWEAVTASRLSARA